MESDELDLLGRVEDRDLEVTPCVPGDGQTVTILLSRLVEEVDQGCQWNQSA